MTSSPGAQRPPRPPTPPPSTPAQLVTSLRVFVTVVTVVLLALGVVLVLFARPGAGTGLLGVLTGVLLGILALVGARLVPEQRTDPLREETGPERALVALRASATTSIVVVEAVSVLAFAASVVLSDVGPYLVGAPLGVLAMVLSAATPGGLRRHLGHLESAGVSTGIRV